MSNNCSITFGQIKSFVHYAGCSSICSYQFVNSDGLHVSCEDPGIFVRGGGGSGQSDKRSSDNFFFISSPLILQKSNGQFQRNLSFLKVPEEVHIFEGGGSNLFLGGGGGGGSKCLFPIQTHITCDFPGGGVRTPCPPSGSALAVTCNLSITTGSI